MAATPDGASALCFLPPSPAKAHVFDGKRIPAQAGIQGLAR
jgi:hypothetical protein